MKKLKSAARRALVITLCIACILAIVPNESHAAGGSYQGYVWYRIRTQEEFFKFAGGSLKKSDGSIKTGGEYSPIIKKDFSGNYPDPEMLPQGNSDDWYRVMITYGGHTRLNKFDNNDKDKYFISGNNSCNDNESFMGQPLNSLQGVDLTKDRFVTISGLNTPYIKYQGWDGDNNCGRFYVRFSDKDKLGNLYWNMRTKWYGVAYHAACSCTFDRPGRDIKNWVDNAEWWSYQSFKWADTVNTTLYDRIPESVSIFYNISGATDRGWEWYGDGEIECTQNWQCYYRLYIGVPVAMSVISSTTFTIPAGTTASWDDYIIDAGGVVTVEEGATLAIDGTCYNTGQIICKRGASLVIRGVLDMGAIPEGKNYYDPGSAGKISMQVDSRLLVDDTGILLTRNPDSMSKCDFDRCLVDIQGTAVFSSGFDLYRADFRVGYGAAVCIGVYPNSSKGVESYTKKWIRDNKSTTLSTLCSNNPVGWNGDITLEYSSLQSNGLFYLNPAFGLKVYTIGYDSKSLYNSNGTINSDIAESSNSFISINRASIIGAPISNMMLKW